MAQEIREFAVRVPAGTGVASPLVTNIGFPSRTVIAVTYRVPPGPSGVMGWALTSAGAPVIPIQPHTYIVTDNQAATWGLDGYLDSGNWQVTAYNTGTYDHTVYLTFELDLPGSVETSPPPLTVVGVGVVDTGGAATTPPPQPGGSTSGSPPAADDSSSVVTAVLAALVTQLQAAGG